MAKEAASLDERLAAAALVSRLKGAKDMRACLIIAACVAAWCFAAEPRAKADEHPDTPAVWVVEIGPTSNWVKMQVDLETELGEDAVYRQARTLGNYMCSLYGRRSVGLSEWLEGTRLEPRMFMLFACAPE